MHAPLGMIRAFILAITLGVLLGGCAGMVAERFSGSVSKGILNQDDPATVRAGAPAYLLLIDGMIEGDPHNQELLVAGSRLYASYATVFVEEPTRARRMTDKSLNYARRALCDERPHICRADQGPYATFVATLADTSKGDLATLYAYGAGWAAWINARSKDPVALADLPKVEAVLDQVLALDGNYERGQPHLYLGILRSQLPPALGGKPEVGQYHFRRAVNLSQERDLTAKVEYARHYARLIFDRDLHDQLLHEVIADDPLEPGLTLSNVLAQEQARLLLESADDYFGE